jgi:uncharacterized membrane protein YkvA (DUF1232 family)
MNKKEHTYYLKLRTKMQKWLEGKDGKENQWSQYLLWAPDLFYMLWKLSMDENVPKKEKLKLLAVLAYFISPLDLIPEAILGPAAFADDIALTAYVLNSLMNHVDADLVRKYWMGEDDALEVIQKILMVADKMVGKGLWQKLKGKLG